MAMATINTHGLRIDLESLQKAADQTTDWPPYRGRTDIKYDLDTGEVWCVDHLGGQEESWTQYPGNVIGVTSTEYQRSAQWIADAIYEALGE